SSWILACERSVLEQRRVNELIPKIIDRGNVKPCVLPAGERARGTRCRCDTAGFVFSENTRRAKCGGRLALRTESLPLVRRLSRDGGSVRPQRQHARQPRRFAFPL